MNMYFDLLEKEYKMPVVIAAHPKSNYSGNEFGKRRIIKYNTDNLIKFSKMVTMHVCNSVSYAILENKPIALVATDEYMNLTSTGSGIKLLAQTLGLNYFNLDKCNYNEIIFEKVPQKYREEYIYNYLTSPEIENIPNWKILRDKLI